MKYSYSTVKKLLTCIYYYRFISCMALGKAGVYEHTALLSLINSAR